MQKLARFFIENYKLTFIISVFVVVFGVMGLLRINAESYPAVNFAMATVVTSFDGASAEDVETRITKPIEDELRTVSGIKDVRSISQPGLSSIFIRADLDNIVVAKVMTELQRAVDRVTDLPQELKDPPKFTEIKSEEFPAIEIAVVGSNQNRERDKIADMLKEEIEDNDRVLNVRLTGFRERQFLVKLNREKLALHHIGIEEIISKISARNLNIPGGKLEKPNEQHLVRIEGKVASTQDIGNIPLRANFSGKSILLKDVATIVDAQEDIPVLAQHNGRDATLVVVNKKAGSDTIELVTDVNEKVERFRQQYKGFEFAIYANESNRVKDKLAVLSSNAVSGLVMVVFFLLIFLPGRIGILASLSLPISLMAMIGLMPIMDVNLNAITILALVIALGMLVDNSVVISENYARLRAEGFRPDDAAIESIRVLWLPITATVLTTIAAFMPMLVTKGIMGQFIKYIPIIVSISLLISLFESFILLPMRLTRTDSGRTLVAGADVQKKGWFDKVSDKFEALTAVLVRWRYLVAVGFTGLLILSFVMIGVFNKLVLFPTNQTEIYTARLNLPKGNTKDQTNAALKEVSTNLLAATKGKVTHIVSRSGTSQMGPADPKGEDGDNVGSLVIYVNDETRDNVETNDMLKILREVKPSAPNAKLVIEAQVNGPPVGDPVNATFRSNNKVKLNALVEEIVTTLKATDGVRDVAVDDVFGDDKIFVQVDYLRSAQLGLDFSTIGNDVRAAVAGKVVSNVNLENKEVGINIRFDDQDRLEKRDLANIRVMDRLGNLVPLSTVATLVDQPADAYIKRFDFKRAKTITAGIEEGKITSNAANAVVAKRFEELKKDYPEVSLIFGGEGESTNESMESLWSALVISLIGIFALLVFTFNSFLRPFIIMTTIPLGLVGFSVAFFLHQKPVSFLALIGVIGLGGIIVNAGIILIGFIDELRSQFPNEPIEKILVKASRLRLRAVVVSSLTTISGLFPTAYGIGGADEMLMPMTLAMAWGLTSGTILTLLWVPCAYLIIEDWSAFTGRVLNKLFRRKNSEQMSNGVKDDGPQLTKRASGME
jgi:multidrug efflux pump subunit AcrB